MHNSYHGIISAYEAAPGLGALVARRTSASLPIAGRFRMIDFPLSAMVNAGVRDVGVIMQRDYQSLLDHLGSGKDWDLSRRNGGLKLLPPFGLPDSNWGEYKGCMEALSAVRSYIEDIKKPNIIMARGDFAANVDLKAAMAFHERRGAKITAICSGTAPKEVHHRFLQDANDCTISRDILCGVNDRYEGIPSLQIYILRRDVLLEMISHCVTGARLHFHRDALTWYFRQGGKVDLFLHEGYARQITTVKDYYEANMDMLSREVRSQLFLPERPIRTKERAEVSTYYGENAKASNCLLADGCYVEGQLEDCVVFRGVRIGKDVHLKGCIIMQDTVVGPGARLAHVVSDKNVLVSANRCLTGSRTLPFVIPKGARV